MRPAARARSSGATAGSFMRDANVANPGVAAIPAVTPADTKFRSQYVPSSCVREHAPMPDASAGTGGSHLHVFGWRACGAGGGDWPPRPRPVCAVVACRKPTNAIAAIQPNRVTFMRSHSKRSRTEGGAGSENGRYVEAGQGPQAGRPPILAIVPLILAIVR